MFHVGFLLWFAADLNLNSDSVSDSDLDRARAGAGPDFTRSVLVLRLVSEADRAGGGCVPVVTATAARSLALRREKPGLGERQGFVLDRVF